MLSGKGLALALLVAGAFAAKLLNAVAIHAPRGAWVAVGVLVGAGWGVVLAVARVGRRLRRR